MKFRFSSVPYIVWSIIFVVVPLILVAVFGLSTSDGQFTFANIAKVSDYTAVFVRSIWLSLVATALCLVIAYPLGFIMSRYSANNQRTLVMLVMLPMWTNFLLRTYAWMTLLENNGVINSILEFFGVGPFKMIYTQGAVVLGMVYNYLPFMILPIYTCMKKMDRRVVEAAEDLGANPLQVFCKVSLPLSVPGIVSGITMVFMPAVTTFAISKLLGGGMIFLIGDMIENMFMTLKNWQYGSTISMILLVVIIASVALLRKVDPDNQGGGLW